jgi:hypothetical protein
VIDYSHRDRRAQRDVSRALGTVIAVTVVLTAGALLLPLPYVGIAAVLALAVLGAAYLGWSERTLSSYATDLRRAREGQEIDGFLRVEVTTEVGLERPVGRPTSPSPHARRRHLSSSGNGDGSSDGSDERSRQP